MGFLGAVAEVLTPAPLLLGTAGEAAIAGVFSAGGTPLGSDMCRQRRRKLLGKHDPKMFCLVQAIEAERIRSPRRSTAWDVCGTEAHLINHLHARARLAISGPHPLFAIVYITASATLKLLLSLHVRRRVSRYEYDERITIAHGRRKTRTTGRSSSSANTAD